MSARTPGRRSRAPRLLALALALGSGAGCHPWEPEEGHAVVALRGAHETADCAACHPSEPFGPEVRTCFGDRAVGFVAVGWPAVLVPDEAACAACHACDRPPPGSTVCGEPSAGEHFPSDDDTCVGSGCHRYRDPAWSTRCRGGG